MMMIKNRITIITMIILVLLSVSLTKKITKKKVTHRSLSSMKNNNTSDAAGAPAPKPKPTPDGKGGKGGAAKGTDVFAGKSNATNAVGFVGTHVHTIVQPPYDVVSCDQILQIKGTTLDLKNYDDSLRKPSFMTLSIYMANFFKTNNSSDLLESIDTQMLNHELTEIPGAPGCTMFKTQKQSRPFCFENNIIRKQINAAVQKFLNCKPDAQSEMQLELALANCDLAKVDLTKRGPFGKFGKKIKKILKKIKEKKEKANDQSEKWSDVNPYYLHRGVPGEELPPHLPDLGKDKKEKKKRKDDDDEDDD